MPRNVTVASQPAFSPAAFTRRASSEHIRRRTRLREVLLDAYTALLALGTVVALAVGLVLALREQVAGVWDSGAGTRRTLVNDAVIALPTGMAPVILLFAVLAGVLVGARRFGPATVTPAEAYWWLGLPHDRRPLLAGRLARRVLLAGAAAAALYLPFGFITAWQAAPTAQFVGAATYGLAAAAAVLMAGLRQTGLNRSERLEPPVSYTAGRRVSGGSRTGRVRTAVETLLGLTVLAYCSVITTAATHGEAWRVPIVLTLTLALWLVVSSRLERISGRELISGGAASGHAGAALYLMDPNEFGRALSGTRLGRSLAPSRARRWYSRGASTAFGALLRADTIAFVRMPGLWVRPLLLPVLCVAVLVGPETIPMPVQLMLVAATVCAVVPAAGALARQTSITPGLDALLPISPAAVRLSRLSMPAAALALWSALFVTVLVLLGAGSPALIGLGALAGPGLGAAAVRGAYRPLPDWTVPPSDTVFGPMPTVQAGSMIRGLDAVLLALVPLLLGLFLGYVPCVLLLAQTGFSAACILQVVFSNPK